MKNKAKYPKSQTILLMNEPDDHHKEIIEKLKNFGFEFVRGDGDEKLSEITQRTKPDVAVFQLQNDTLNKGMDNQIFEIRSLRAKIKVIGVYSGSLKYSVGKAKKMGLSSTFQLNFEDDLYISEVFEHAPIDVPPKKVTLEALTRVNIIELENQTLPFDVYLFLPSNKKSILYRPAGQELDKKVVAKFKNHKHFNLYIRKSDLKTYKKFSAAILMKLQGSEDATTELGKRKVAGEIKKLMGGFFSETDFSTEDGQQVVDNVGRILEEYVEETCENKEMLTAVQQLAGEHMTSYTHARNVATYCVMFGMSKGVGTAEELHMGGLLHDIGMSDFPTELLWKAEEDMSEKEIAQYKLHPGNARLEVMTRGLKVTEAIMKMVLQHHERPDGSGFPYGLTADEIHPMAKICAFADEFDRLTSVRAGEKMYKPVEAVNNISGEDGSPPNPIYEKEFHEQIVVDFKNDEPLPGIDSLSNNKAEEIYEVSEEEKQRLLEKYPHIKDGVSTEKMSPPEPDILANENTGAPLPRDAMGEVIPPDDGSIEVSAMEEQEIQSNGPTAEEGLEDEMLPTSKGTSAHKYLDDNEPEDNTKKEFLDELEGLADELMPRSPSSDPNDAVMTNDPSATSEPMGSEADSMTLTPDLMAAMEDLDPARIEHINDGLNVDPDTKPTTQDISDVGNLDLKEADTDFDQLNDSSNANQVELDRKLLSSAKENDMEGVQYCLSNGADIDAQDEDGNSALMLAAQNGNENVANELLDHGANIDLLNKLNENAVDIASNSEHQSLLESIQDFKSKRKSPSKRPARPLHLSVRKKSKTAAPSRHQPHIDVNKRNKQGQTLLLQFSAKGDLQTVNQLIELGADVNAKDFKGHTSLIFASNRGHAAVVERLLQAGARTNPKDSQGRQAIIHAVEHKHVEVLKALVKYDAKVDVRFKGLTLLMLGAFMGQYEICEILLQYGARPDDKDFKGKTAVEYAIIKGHIKVAELINGGPIRSTG